MESKFRFAFIPTTGLQWLWLVFVQLKFSKKKNLRRENIVAWERILWNRWQKLNKFYEIWAEYAKGETQKIT